MDLGTYRAGVKSRLELKRSAGWSTLDAGDCDHQKSTGCLRDVEGHAGRGRGNGARMSSECPPRARRAALAARRPSRRAAKARGSAAGYLTGLSDALAAAQLQDRVKSVVESAGRPASLYEVETGQPSLIIDDVTVHQERVRRRNDPEREPVLDVSLELLGYLREQPV